MIFFLQQEKQSHTRTFNNEKNTYENLLIELIHSSPFMFFLLQKIKFKKNTHTLMKMQCNETIKFK